MSSYLPAQSRDKVFIRLAACCVGKYGVFVLLALSHIKYCYFMSLAARREGRKPITTNTTTTQKQIFLVTISTSLLLFQGFSQHFILPSRGVTILIPNRKLIEMMLNVFSPHPCLVACVRPTSEGKKPRQRPISTACSCTSRHLYCVHEDNHLTGTRGNSI